MPHTALSKRVAELKESATMALDARVKQMAASGQTVYNLTAGELDCPTPSFIQDAVGQTLHHNKYTALSGMAELRSAIASHTCSFYGIDWVTSAHVVVTAGAKPALATTFLALINPGDEVILPTPAWVSYRHLIELAGGTVIEVPLTNAWDLDVSAIKDSITARTKLVLLNSPHNPTGAIFSADSLTALADLLKGTDTFVLADDIYTKLVYVSGYSPITAYGFDIDHLVIINGFSKSQALTGWRIGYVVSNTTVAKAIAKLLSHITGNASVLSQFAAIAALSRNDTPEMLPELRRRRDFVASKLAEIPKLSFEKPAGAFYYFLDLREITSNTAEWCEQLLIDKHVALVPGEAFAAPGFARLSFAASEETLAGAIKPLHEFVTGGPVK